MKLGDTLYYRDEHHGLRFFRVLAEQSRSIVVREVGTDKRGKGKVSPRQGRHDFIGASPMTLRLKGGGVSFRGHKLLKWDKKPMKVDESLDERAPVDISLDTHRKGKRTCPGGAKCPHCGNPSKTDLARVSRREMNQIMAKHKAWANAVKVHEGFDGHAEMMMEVWHVSASVLEMGSLTEANLAVKATGVIGKLKNQDLYRKIVGGEGFSMKQGLQGLSTSERKQFAKQLADAAKRRVAEGDLEAGEVKQVIAHIMELMGRVRVKSQGRHYGGGQKMAAGLEGADLDTLFEAELAGEENYDNLFEAELTEALSKSLPWTETKLDAAALAKARGVKFLYTTGTTFVGFEAHRYKEGEGWSGQIQRRGAGWDEQKAKHYTDAKVLKMFAKGGMLGGSKGGAGQAWVSKKSIYQIGEDLLSEGYAKAGDDPDWGENQTAFDKMMMDQDLSKEEMVNVSKYLDAVANARGPWENSPAQLDNPTVTAGPSTDYEEKPEPKDRRAGLGQQTEGFYRRNDKKKQKAEWMKRYAKVAKQSGRKKIDWDAAHHFYYQGMDADNAAAKSRTHIKDVA